MFLKYITAVQAKMDIRKIDIYRAESKFVDKMIKRILPLLKWIYQEINLLPQICQLLVSSIKFQRSQTRIKWWENQYNYNLKASSRCNKLCINFSRNRKVQINPTKKRWIFQAVMIIPLDASRSQLKERKKNTINTCEITLPRSPIGMTFQLT